MRTFAFLAAVLAVSGQEPDQVYTRCLRLFKCENYVLNEFPTNEADKHMTVANADNTPSEIPATLHGLLYLDGHPRASELVSFANCEWLAEENACVIQVYGENWARNSGGAGGFEFAYYANWEYLVVISEDKLSARFIPRNVPRRLINWLVQFTMRFEREGIWIRESTMFGGLVPSDDYTVRTIVDGNGDRTENWDIFIGNINVEGKTLTESLLVSKKIN